MFRKPRTANEARAAAVLEKEVRAIDTPVKIRRKARQLPSAYDDISAGRQRSWKKHRKTKWRKQR